MIEVESQKLKRVAKTKVRKKASNFEFEFGAELDLDFCL